MKNNDNCDVHVLNLHDCYNTANLLRVLMLGTAPDQEALRDPLLWPISDRARLERLWWAMTYVLIEAWRAPRPPEVGQFLARLEHTPRVEAALAALDDAGVIDKLRECRHYMCHRDHRAYWDAGRMASLGHFSEMLELSATLGALFVEALDKMKRSRA
jgi:hypothetical protein